MRLSNQADHACRIVLRQGYVVDTVLPVPVNAAQTIALANLTTLASTFQQVNPQALLYLGLTPRLTIFAVGSPAELSLAVADCVLLRSLTTQPLLLRTVRLLL